MTGETMKTDYAEAWNKAVTEPLERLKPRILKIELRVRLLAELAGVLHEFEGTELGLTPVSLLKGEQK